MNSPLVGFTKFPNMNDGQIGFAINSKANCMEPHYPYQNGDANGFIHIRNNEELIALAHQIGAMTKKDFFRQYSVGPKDPWRNDYIRYLDNEIFKALLKTGIQLTINNIEVMFYTKPEYYKRTNIQHSKRFLKLYKEI